MTLEVIVLSAGDATRMPDAPYGCKSLVELAGIPVIEWQVNALPEDCHVTVVARPRVSQMFDEWGCDVIAHDVADGPVKALQRVPIDGPVLVLFADTIFESIPEVWDDSWVGVAVARGGRVWEYAGPDGHIRPASCTHPISCAPPLVA
jgi:GTP:adenosylcobinamide-phosphate guanylyltransferase